MTIWKFSLDATDTVKIPITHRIISVGEQDGHITLWAIVDPGSRIIDKTFLVVGTGDRGWRMDGIMQRNFVGTVQMEDGLVWHVFE